MGSPFDVVKNINSKKGLLTEDELIKDYDSFVINKSFSGTTDTLFIANEVNKFTGLPSGVVKEMSYRFYYGVVDKDPRRYAPWYKSKKDSMDDIIAALSEYYKVSRRAAKDMVELHSDEELSSILKATFKGGKQ